MKEIKLNIPDGCDEIRVLLYPSEAIRALIPYKDNNKHGVAKRYYENGKLWSETHYKDGKKEGVEKSYHDNGKLWYETPFKDDKRDGVEKWYHLNGDLVRECTYKYDELISEKEIK